MSDEDNISSGYINTRVMNQSDNYIYYNSEQKYDFRIPSAFPIIIYGEDRRVILTLHPNGKLELDPQDAEEAAQVFMKSIFTIAANIGSKMDFKDAYVLSLEQELEAAKLKIVELENRLTSAMTRGLSNPNR